MKSDRPFRKSFTCGGALYVLVLCISLFAGARLSAHQIGYLMSSLFIFPSLAAGTWGWFSKKSWTWLRFAVTVIGFTVLFVILQVSSHIQHP